MKFKITQTTFDKCQLFAEQSVNSSKDQYARRNQFNIEKIKSDIRNGKLAEEIAFAFFKNKFADLTPPDYNIYDKKQKSWDPDLKSSECKIAVKSQTIESANSFGKSWVFQSSDLNIFNSSKEEDKKHFACFITLNIIKKIGQIDSVVSIDYLKSNSLFKEMKKQTLQNNKKAVYFEDLKEVPFQL